MEARLKSGIWVKALIRRCDIAAVGVAVMARGDDDAGAVLLKLNGRDTGCTVLSQTRRPDGTPSNYQFLFTQSGAGTHTCFTDVYSTLGSL